MTVDDSPVGGRWLASADPDGVARRKALRAAVLMPLVFAFAFHAVGNAQMALFGSFGSFALLVLTEVDGPPRVRLVAFAVLAAVGSVLVTVGTWCAGHTGLAVASMAVVGFVVLLAGAVSPLAAMMTTAALLTFILPVSIPAAGADLGARLAGWLLAVAVCVPALMLVWPPRFHDRLRLAVGRALESVRDLLVRRDDPSSTAADLQAALDEAQRRVVALQWQFEATPYRPVTSAGRGLALAKLVDDLDWVRAAAAAGIATESGSRALCRPQAAAVWSAAADVLDQVAAEVASGRRSRPDDPRAGQVRDAIGRLRQARRTLSAQVAAEFEAAALAPEGEGGGPVPSVELMAAVASALDARRVANATELVGRHGLLAAGLDEGADFAVTPATQLESFASVRSVWFRTAARGAIGLALAVSAAKLLPIQHGFWVVLGTLSVLRSSAVGTGSSALKAFVGTLVGFVIAAAVLAGISHHAVLLWVALPISVFVASVAPTLISFVAGQAAFTVVVVVLFNLLDPVGWQVGLIRVENVAIGCAISVVVGALCWPRGAAGVFGGALGAALSSASAYLQAAVEAVTGGAPGVEPDLRACHLDALTADRRLDDAFRLFLTERAAKRVGLDAANRLVAGAVRIRLAAFSLDSLGDRPPVRVPPLTDASTRSGSGSGTEATDRAARALCLRAAEAHRWYVGATAALAEGQRRLDEAPPGPLDLSDLVADALDEARASGRPARVRHTLSLIWTEHHLAHQGRLQHELADRADQLLALRRRW